MDSKFVKTENDNDMVNDIQTEPTARRSISATKLGKPSRYGEYRTVKILFVEGGCFVLPILFHHLVCACVLNLSCVFAVTLAYHHSIFVMLTDQSPSDSFHLP